MSGVCVRSSSFYWQFCLFHIPTSFILFFNLQEQFCIFLFFFLMKGLFRSTISQGSKVPYRMKTSHMSEESKPKYGGESEAKQKYKNREKKSMRKEEEGKGKERKETKRKKKKKKKKEEKRRKRRKEEKNIKKGQKEKKKKSDR